MDEFYKKIKGKLFNLGLFAYGDSCGKDAIYKILKEHESSLKEGNVIISKKQHEILKRDSDNLSKVNFLN